MQSTMSHTRTNLPMKTEYYHTTMQDMENMDAFEWAEYLAYGDPIVSELTPEESQLIDEWDMLVSNRT